MQTVINLCCAFVLMLLAACSTLDNGDTVTPNTPDSSHNTVPAGAV